MATKKYDLFVSYADADGEWVEGYLIDALQQAGVNYCSKETFTLGAEMNLRKRLEKANGLC
jgi:hypothetical protein